MSDEDVVVGGTWPGRSGKNKYKELKEFPLWHNGLRIWHCQSRGIGQSSGSDLTPGLGISMCHEGSQKRKTMTATKGAQREQSAKFQALFYLQPPLLLKLLLATMI